MNNSVRHGKAVIIWINLSETKRGTELIIRDNGQGFNEFGGEEGHGLRNMTERAETIGGHFEISSVEGRGTVIRIVIPNSDE